MRGHDGKAKDGNRGMIGNFELGGLSGILLTLKGREANGQDY